MVRFGVRRQRVALAGGGQAVNKNGGGACNNGGLVITVMLGAFVTESGCCGHVKFLKCILVRYRSLLCSYLIVISMYFYKLMSKGMFISTNGNQRTILV